MGYEWLTQLAADDEGVLVGGFDAENLTLALDYTSAAEGSEMFADDGVRKSLGELPITMNNHHAGVDPRSFDDDAGLRAFFDVLAVNTDRKGRPFVSAIEAKAGAPVFAVQFHPEK